MPKRVPYGEFLMGPAFLLKPHRWMRVTCKSILGVLCSRQACVQAKSEVARENNRVPCEKKGAVSWPASDLLAYYD